MKKITIFIVALLMLLATSAQAALVGEWHVDEGSGTIASDSSGYGNHGTIDGASWADGICGSALDFDGTDDYVEVPNDDSLDMAEMTVAAWVFIDPILNAGEFSGLVTKSNGSSYGGGFFLGYDRRNITGNSKTTNALRFATLPSGADDTETWLVDAIPSPDFYHVAGTFDGSVARLYLDGVLVDTGNTPSAPIAFNTLSLRIGASYFLEEHGFNDRFDGIIDEIRIYNHAMIADEIEALLNCGVIEVEIDIKPGSYPNTINLGSQGVIPVAILSSSDFDATTVDPSTVKLSGAGIAIRGKSDKYLAHEEDVNGDGLLDLVCKVETENLDPEAFQYGFADLTGQTYDGVSIKGYDEIIIVPPEE